MKIVVKVGSSTLTNENGKLDLKLIEKLTRILSSVKNMGHDVILVTSGAQAAGMSKLRLTKKPQQLPKKQALAAIGQCELMAIYDRFFADYGYTVGQILLNKEVVDIPELKRNVKNTFSALLHYDIIPIVNENDSVEVDEIKFGDNDTLSATVAAFVKADKLIILTDVEALYDSDPTKNPNAKPINVVSEINDSIRSLAGDTSTSRGTGGMITKIRAAEAATSNGIDMHIIYGKNPSLIYDIIEGKRVGTVFLKQS